MQDSNIPAKFAIPFANGAGAGYIRTVPQASQISVQNGAASLTDGFPPNCFMPIAAGGSWPFGQDFNGLLNQATAWARWQAAGGPIAYDAAFQSAVGGYPKGSVVQSATTAGVFWQSTADNNTTNPDTGGAGWAVWGLGSLASNGYMTLPGNIILQWGTNTTSAWAGTYGGNVTFPIAFPHACLTVVICEGGAGTWVAGNATMYAPSSFTQYVFALSGLYWNGSGWIGPPSGSPFGQRWIALGY